MIYLRCFCYETVMVAIGPMMELTRSAPAWMHAAICNLDGIYGRAWDALYDARSELEEKLSNRFPVA